MAGSLDGMKLRAEGEALEMDMWDVLRTRLTSVRLLSG